MSVWMGGRWLVCWLTGCLAAYLVGRGKDDWLLFLTEWLCGHCCFQVCENL